MKKINKLITAVLVMSTSVAVAVPILFSGTTPTNREDGETLGLSEIAGFNIYCGTVSGEYSDMIFFPGATLPETEWNIDKPIGNYLCVVTTLDIDGRESVYSNEVAINVVGKSRPNPPMIPMNTVIEITVTLP